MRQAITLFMAVPWVAEKGLVPRVPA
jgi:hypothetical protein